MQALFSLHRCDDDTSVCGGAGHGVVGAGVCSVRAAWPALLPDPAHGAHGQTRRDLETSRLRRLCSSTGTKLLSGYFYINPLKIILSMIYL